MSISSMISSEVTTTTHYSFLGHAYAEGNTNRACNPMSVEASRGQRFHLHTSIAILGLQRLFLRVLVLPPVMSSPIDVSAIPSRARYTRKCKPTSFSALLISEPSEEAWSDSRSTSEGDEDSDPDFISQDEFDGSGDEYNDTDTSDENHSISSDSHSDYTNSSDDEPIERTPAPIRIVSNASAAKENKSAGSETEQLGSTGTAPAHGRAISNDNR
jgi:hypothetical protein